MNTKALFTALIFSALAVWSVPVFSQQKQLSPKTDGKHKADGDLDEWGTLRNTVKPDGYQYDVAADESNIYLGIKVYDFYLKRKMLTTGLIAGIGGLEITFPFPQQKPAEKKDAKEAPPGNRPGPPAGKRPPMPKGDSAKTSGDTSQFGRFVAAIREMQIEGLSGGIRLSDQTDQTGIYGRLGIDHDQNLVYELSIPKKLLSVKKGRPEDLAITIPAIRRNLPYTPYYNRMYDPYGRTYGGYGGYGGRYGGGYSPYGYGYLPPMPAQTLPDGPDASLYKKTMLKTAVIFP